MDGAVVFNRWRQCAPYLIHVSLGPGLGFVSLGPISLCLDSFLCICFVFIAVYCMLCCCNMVRCKQNIVLVWLRACVSDSDAAHLTGRVGEMGLVVLKPDPQDHYFFQYFDTVGCVIWPTKGVPNMTCNVFIGTHVENVKHWYKTPSVRGNQRQVQKVVGFGCCRWQPFVDDCCRSWQVLMM